MDPIIEKSVKSIEQTCDININVYFHPLTMQLIISVPPSSLDH